MLLQLKNHEVRICYDGQSAFKIACAFVPDVMLVDLGMPSMSGIRLAELIRQQKSLSDTLLVAVTGHADKSVEEAALAAGFRHYLLKPFDIADLLAVITESKAPVQAEKIMQVC